MTFAPIALDRVVQSPIKLTQGQREFWFQFCNFLVNCSVYVVCPSVLSSSNLKLHQTLEGKNIFKQENIMLKLTFNPGLTLTGFRTTQPWKESILKRKNLVVVNIFNMH